MKLHLTNLAVAKLRLLLWEEKGLAIHVVLLTTGCNTPSFGLEVTEIKENMRYKSIQEIPFVWYPDDEEWLSGITIDINRDNGKFMIDHPSPKLLTNCPIEQQGDDQHLDK